MKKIWMAWLAGLLLSPVYAGENPDKNWTEAVELFRALEKSFSEVRTVQARFTEEKKIAILDRVLHMEGRMALEIPGKLAWRVEKPLRYKLTLKGREAFQWDEETRRVQRIPLAGNPVLEGVLSQMQQWFSGQFASLQADYDVQIISASPPQMAFRPRADRGVAKVIRRIEIRIQADGRYVEQIEMEDVSGDLTTIRFHDTVLNAPVDPSEWEAVPR
ncbi:MAG: outer membrane lipoprotein carrier protein LolA [Kiritimatiellia bacterium]|nr:outer membrane lipoprotein carrier protein LolA [Kiritimatiellia bacterium]